MGGLLETPSHLEGRIRAGVATLRGFRLASLNRWNKFCETFEAGAIKATRAVSEHRIDLKVGARAVEPNLPDSIK